MSGRGRSSSRGGGSSSSSVGGFLSSRSSLGLKRRGLRSRGGGRGALSSPLRRPKFSDNPLAPEIVEKTELNGGSSETHDNVESRAREEAGDTRDPSSSSETSYSTLALDSSTPEEPPPQGNPNTTTFLLNNASSASSFSEAQAIPLEQVDSGMIPLDTVAIQEYKVLEDNRSSPLLSRPLASHASSSLFDKSSLFSQMETTFAKDTQEALKHRPVYNKKTTLSPPASMTTTSPPPPILTPEVIQEPEAPSRLCPAVLSRSDAETAAFALQLQFKPSLKTVIRLPSQPVGIPRLSSPPHSIPTNPTPSHPPPPPTNGAKKKKKGASPKCSSPDPDEEEEEDALIIDEEGGGEESEEAAKEEDQDPHPLSPRSSPLTPQNPPGQTLTPAAAKPIHSSPDSHKSEEKPPESMVVPEKASSFNIHPERCCSDMCHYCGLKFGMLDTPLHVSQLKTSEVRKKVEDITGFEKDACLCDKCFRFLDRRAKSAKQGDNDLGLVSGASVNPAMDKRKQREESSRKDERKCIVRNCNREVTENVSKKWLVRLKKKLVRKISLDWERVGRGSVKSVFPVCHKHHSWVDFYSSCGLCKKKLTVGGICTLGISKQEVHELNVLLREDRIPAELVENHFVCKLCKTFCNLKQKLLVSPEAFKKAQKGFCKDYKKRLYQCLRLDGGESSSDVSGDASSNGGSKTPKKIHQVSQSDNPTKITIKTTTLPLDEEEEVSSPEARPTRKRRGKEAFSASPSSIKVSESSSTSVSISFDLNTKKLWQDMHFPYGNYTAFFRHLILLEKFWRNGDLQLSENASEKSSVYIKSVHNRIRAYESGRSNVKKSSLSSDVDLSASTRPDLSVPPVPLFLHEPPEEEDEEATEDPPYKPSPTPPPPPPPKQDKQHQPEILKIPKVVPCVSRNDHHLGEEEPPLPWEESSPPTKIRVRTDLMHLGLMAKSPTNLMKEKKAVKPSSSSSSAVSSMTPSTSSSISSPVPTTTTTTTTTNTNHHHQPSPHAPPPPPILSTNKKMSPHTISSLLSDNSDNSSSKPITHSRPSQPNTSNASSRHSNPAPEKKAPSSSNHPPPPPPPSAASSPLFMKESSSAIPLTFNNSIAEVLEAANKAASVNSGDSPVSMALASKPEITITAKPLSKHPSTTTASSSSSSSKTWMTIPSEKGKKTTGNSANRSPILDMTKLLQSTNPGLPPHLVAQDQHNKIRPQSNPRSTPVRPPPPQLSSLPLKKSSINNILDRLSGLKVPPPPHSSAPSATSSLVQQLQAPPVHRLPRPQQVAAAQQLMWAGLHPPSGPPPQYDWLSQTQALMMAGALPTLDQVQAAQRVQAFQELMNMGNKGPRMRAPPPLTHMGKGSGPGGSSSANKTPKND